tara:strand:+ start:407 stop:529 length:123 start_codon:yes stop_codon:yes gene_type:complete
VLNACKKRLKVLKPDTGVDPQTHTLMGRFFCEQRDTVRRL